jgi:hypothetical protein
MKNIIILFLIFPLLFILSGCPYYSKVPLTEMPKTSIDTLLLGTWKIDENKPEADSGEMKIIKFNPNEYYIEMFGLNRGKIEIDRYRAYITPVGKTNLLNLEDLKTKGTYSFFRYKLSGNKLDIEIVSDECIKEDYTTSKELLKVFTKKINDTTFFESGIKFVRKE